MIDTQLFFIFLISFALIYFALGFWASRKVHTLQNYFLADRNLSVFQLTFALIASQLGSGMILGTAYRAYHVGIWGILYSVGMSVGFIILGSGLASRMRGLNIATTAEIFETHYGSSRLKMFASMLSVVSLWGILIAQIVASRTLFAGIGINNPYVFISCWLLVICYTMLGGLQSLVMVDIAQVTFIIAVFIAATWYALPAAPDLMSMVDMQSTYFHCDVSLTVLAPAIFIPTLFSLIEQDLAQKFFAAKSKKTATISALLAGLFLICFSCIPLFFGMIAKMNNIDVPLHANPLVTLLYTVCPPVLFLLVMCGIIAAITSTANSLMCAISSNIVQDFENSLQLKHQKLYITKIISSIIGISALTASYFMKGDIISILEESYRISVICLLVPTVRAYFGPKAAAAPAWVSCITGCIGYVVLHVYPQTPILNDVVPLMASCIGYFVAHRLVLAKNR